MPSPTIITTLRPIFAFDDADAILMTEKDAVKCAAFANEKCWVLRVDAQVSPALAQLIMEKVTP